MLHRFVVLKNVLAHLEVALFNLALCLLDLPREYRRLDVVAFLHAHGGEHLEHRLAREHLHEIIVKREEKPTRTLIALSTCAATQLIVDATTLVAFRADNVQSAHRLNARPNFQSMQRRASLQIKLHAELFFAHRVDLALGNLCAFIHPMAKQHLTDFGCFMVSDDLLGERALRHVLPTEREDFLVVHRRIHFLGRNIATLPMLEKFEPREGAQLDVGTATSHVRRDHHRAERACARHDFRFTLVVLRVEHFMLDLMLRREQSREMLAALDARRSCKHGKTNIVERFHVLNDRIPLVLLREVHTILPICARDRNIRRNAHDIESIDFVELSCFSVRRTGHAREALVKLEVILNRDCRHGLRLFFDTHTFLGFDRLMKSIRPLSADHLASCVLIDDHNAELPVLVRRNHVITIALINHVRAKRLLNQVREIDVVADVETAHACGFLRFRNAIVRELRLLLIKFEFVELRKAIALHLELPQVRALLIHL